MSLENKTWVKKQREREREREKERERGKGLSAGTCGNSSELGLASDSWFRGYGLESRCTSSFFFTFRVVDSVSSPSDDTKNRGPLFHRPAHVKDPTKSPGQNSATVVWLTLWTIGCIVRLWCGRLSSETAIRISNGKISRSNNNNN